MSDLINGIAMFCIATMMYDNYKKYKIVWKCKYRCLFVATIFSLIIGGSRISMLKLGRNIFAHINGMIIGAVVSMCVLGKNLRVIIKIFIVYYLNNGF